MNQAQKVYLVDDDPQVLRSLAQMVESGGYGVASFTSGEALLEVIDPECTGCAIVDLQMPGMSGLALQQALVERKITLPVIIVSGFADVPVTVAAMRQGAVTLLEKPYKREDIIAAIQTAIERDQMWRKQSARLQEIATRLATLTGNEQKILAAMLEGKPNKTVAMHANLSMRTIDRRKRSLLEKMHASSVVELVKMMSEYQQANSSDNPPQSPPDTPI